MSDAPGEEELIEVQILGLPVEEQQRAAEHVDELLREFSLIRDEVDSPVPHRLIELREQLNRDFAAFTEDPRMQIESAAARGAATVDVRYLVPPTVGGAARALGELLDEADEFCRSGTHLLTLATPPGALRFRRWFLGEFVRQAAAEPPQPWPGPD